ncbi:hypothetical protein [Chamaesiphon sp.]|uniref:type IV pilus modification PilV family protein n=1 Tax=Chamaesiphon sp. TaxID=2814140 RepID=UPI0035930EE6
MSLKLYRGQTFVKIKPPEQGFSLLETVIALTTLGVCLAYAMPLFLYAKVNNSKSEIRTGALIVSQRVFDNIRSRKISDLPLTDGFNNDNLVSCQFSITAGLGRIDTSNGSVVDFKNCVNATPIATANPLLTPNNFNSITADERILTQAMGRQYRTSVTFCQGLAITPARGSIPAIPADPTVCSNKYRQFKVEVFYNGTKVYDLEGSFTDFQQST